MKTLMILPGDNLLMWDGAACGTLSPKRNRNVKQMHQEIADEAIVIVKRKACEGMVTCWREILFESAKELTRAEMKGGT